MNQLHSESEIRRSLRMIEAQLASGFSIYDLATILRQELQTCPNLRQFFPEA